MPKLTPKEAQRLPKRGQRITAGRGKSSLKALWRRALRSPEFGWGALIFAAFVLFAGVISAWSREQPLVAIDRVMLDTRTARVTFEMPDERATEDEREAARQRTPRVYVPTNDAWLLQIREELASLPLTVAGVESIAEIPEQTRQAFGLNEARVTALKRQMEGGEVSPQWVRRVEEFIAELRWLPLISAADWRAKNQELYSSVELRRGEETLRVPKDVEINVEAERFANEIYVLARNAGFPDGPLRELVTERVTREAKPTFRYDAAATTILRDRAAAEVQTITQEVRADQTLYARGTRLDDEQLMLVRRESEEFAEHEPVRAWLGRGAAVIGVLVIAGAMAGYLALFCPPVRRRPARMMWIALLLGSTLLIGTTTAVFSPQLVLLAGVAPVLFVASILVVAYDQRLAFVVGALHALLLAFALRQPMGFLIIMIVAAALGPVLLKEIRDRRTLINMSLISGLSLAVATLLVGPIDRPLTPGAFEDLFADAAFAGAGGLLVGSIVFVILPVIESVFDITTGMTLIERRDPKQPLLRELQQRAPGTYNHSLNVASISEAAADAIGADPLLTYVGGLYHDIGKMNKPEYFVENQSGGPNKHDKLSPAMSLLVIVGHVKDGLELAREFDLPRPLHHFIEAHHGTTLVEYFFERAKRKVLDDAISGDGEAPEPDEIEYRYPGPRPRTKEVAILMLADAVESATRSMAEPTPSRIDALVRDLAAKRLLDGQFDDCDLSLKELRTVADSISKSVASIYHGRIAYPSDKKDKDAKAEKAEKAEKRA